MIHLKFITENDIAKSLSSRDGETKLGQKLQYVSSLEAIASTSARYVLFGIEEDIGVQANYGKAGASKAWNAFLNAFIHVQHNRHNQSHVLLLGHIKVVPHALIDDESSKASLGDVVSRIDKMVVQVIKAIVTAGKIPIIIGGGHNNAYGNLKGASLALNTPLNALNIDAHTDLRTADYRHSGNGFTYALKDTDGPYLKKYSIFGLHKNYTPDYIFQWMDTHSKDIQYRLFEDMTTAKERIDAFGSLLTKVDDGPFGLELDCDVITDFPSSAQTPSGFDLNSVRHFVRMAAKGKYCSYFHICEAAPTKKNAVLVGKALSYLVTDFIRAHDQH